ncbi:MAG: tRNA-dihydrouridine synthase [Planctomycetaceae bacterium]
MIATLADPPPTLAEPPLRIGARVLPSRFSLAPLAGYTQHPFRVAVRELGGLGLATTDLVQAGLLVSGGTRSQHLIATSPEDQPLSVQIFSGRRHELVKAACWLEDHGYQGIDINMGCPMAKVNSQGGGARLMCDPGGACDTVAAVVGAVRLPVTVKMRLGWDETQLTAPALAREFEQLGVAAITVHGRTREQGFTGKVNLDGIRGGGSGRMHPGDRQWRRAQRRRRVAMRAVTGCAGVAIGRGAMLDPWIFRRLAAATGLPPPAEPTIDEKIGFFLRHFRLKQAQHGDYACVLMRSSPPGTGRGWESPKTWRTGCGESSPRARSYCWPTRCGPVTANARIASRRRSSRPRMGRMNSGDLLRHVSESSRLITTFHGVEPRGSICWATRACSSTATRIAASRSTGPWRTCWR